MSDSSLDVSKALFRSLTEAPRLIDDLPEARAFDSLSLIAPEAPDPLNLQQKLGHLYEDALAVMLDATPRYDALASGIQIQQAAGRTLGELDFLVKDRRTDQLIHLELAVKFYLAVETECDPLLPGPDTRDNYYRKLQKMRTHQLLLTKKYRDRLPDAYNNQEIVPQHLVHGCIFNHVNARKPAEAEFLNPHGRRGKWLHAEDCADYFGKYPSLEIIPKPLWPVPLEILEGMELETWKVEETIVRCVMVRAGAERVPYFIAPNGYPISRRA